MRWRASDWCVVSWASVSAREGPVRATCLELCALALAVRWFARPCSYVRSGLLGLECVFLRVRAVVPCLATRGAGCSLSLSLCSRLLSSRFAGPRVEKSAAPRDPLLLYRLTLYYLPGLSCSRYPIPHTAPLAATANDHAPLSPHPMGTSTSTSAFGPPPSPRITARYYIDMSPPPTAI